MPEAGQNMIRGILSSQGIHVPIIRVREAIHAVDPVNAALRWAAPTRRREYSVRRPSALWHIDGNHKLVRLVVVYKMCSL